MKTIDLTFSDAHYSVLIGSGLLDQVQYIVEVLAQPSVVIVTNDHIAKLYLAQLSSALIQKGVQVQHVLIPEGENHKNWQTLNHLFDALLAMHCERKTTLIALGGGMVGDITGFAAAVYQRGIPFIQIPTTLLAQVDAAIGGKTGINHPAGKNMLGAFYQPRLVIADTATLKTLPRRELYAGLAEVIKYGLINDLAFFGWLEANMEALVAGNERVLTKAIECACQNKAQIVMEDQHEQGKRAFLNFGHTFGHAIEAGLGYGAWLHGEAVAAGMVMAVLASQQLGHLQQADVNRVIALLKRANLPVKAPHLGLSRYMALMAQDKKVQDGHLRFILLKNLGEAYIGTLTPAIVACVLMASNGQGET